MDQQIMLAAVLILQLITILLIITGKKKPGRGSGDTRRPSAEFRNEKKDADPRKPYSGAKKPGEHRSGGGGGNRPQQNQPAAAIDPMEKSLRDINLRLKNAEREQESARKKFQESGSGGGRESRENRDGRQPHQRGDRGGSRSGSGHRDFNRDQPRRDSRPERPPYRSEQQENPGFAAAETAHPVTAPAAPDIAVNDIGVSEDQLQHGRKFTAKRRQLPSDGVSENGVPETGIPETYVPETTAAPQFTESAPDVQVEQQTEGTDIQFGRR